MTTPISAEQTWVPADACVLPTAERPVRQAEFHDLFAAALRRVERLGPTWLRLHLDGDARVAGMAADQYARDLSARETRCCSFFEFDVHPGDARDSADHLDFVVDVRVPEQRVAVLDGLEQQARTAAE